MFSISNVFCRWILNQKWKRTFGLYRAIFSISNCLRLPYLKSLSASCVRRSNLYVNSFQGSRCKVRTEERPQKKIKFQYLYTSYCVNALLKCVDSFIDGSVKLSSQNVLFWLANYMPTTDWHSKHNIMVAFFQIRLP